jgi:NAD-dependent deacetylase
LEETLKTADSITGPSASIDDVARWVKEAERVTVLTGAGISTESGIPDFRGPNGLWTKNPAAMRMFEISEYVADPQVRLDAWQERLHHAAWTASPGAGHQALVKLERAGKLRGLITQNIDGLQQAAGSSPDTVLELHGTIHQARCLECGGITPMREQLERVRAGELDPPCGDCGGVQKADTVLFGEVLDRQVLRRAIEAAETCDLFLAVGTSLLVHPAAALCGVAIQAGSRCVIVNAEPTPLDVVADAVLRGAIREILPAIVGQGDRPS